jgi:hypothetical protein
MPSTKYVKPLENFMLYIEFKNEEKRVYDVNILLSDDKEEYKNLQLIPGLFEKVKVRAWGDGIEWTVSEDEYLVIGRGDLYYYSVPYSEEIHGVINTKY